MWELRQCIQVAPFAMKLCKGTPEPVHDGAYFLTMLGSATSAPRTQGFHEGLQRKHSIACKFCSLCAGPAACGDGIEVPGAGR